MLFPAHSVPTAGRISCLPIELALKVRKDCQFHWHNQQYSQTSTNFLATFNSKKRKNVRQDRRARKRMRSISLSAFPRCHEMDSAMLGNARMNSSVLRSCGAARCHTSTKVLFRDDHFQDDWPSNVLGHLCRKGRHGQSLLRYFSSKAPDALVWSLLGQRRTLRCLAFRNLLLPGDPLLYRDMAGNASNLARRENTKLRSRFSATPYKLIRRTGCGTLQFFSSRSPRISE